MRYKILSCGECAVTVEFSREMDSRAGEAAVRLAGELRQRNAAGICEVIPTYRSTAKALPLRKPVTDLFR